MTDEIRPERLDALFDGAAPETDEERDLLHLAAELRAEAPSAPDDLRRRITELGEPDVSRRAPDGWWSRIRWRMAAPAMAGLIAVLVAVAVIPRMTGGSDGDVAASDNVPTEMQSEKIVPDSDSAASAPSADGPTAGVRPAPTARQATPVGGIVRDGSLDQVQDAVVGAVTAAGGRVTSRTDDGSTRTVTADVARADTDRLVDDLMAIDDVSFTRSELDDAVSPAGIVRIELRTR